MRSFFGFMIITCLFFSCDDERVYENNFDFDSRQWLINDQPEFDFEITDTLPPYNLYCNVRNSVAYPYARLFVTYYLQDSAGLLLDKKMVSDLLFDEQTGKPEGTSGLGDIYDHRIPLKLKYRFGHSGKYKVRFEQYMRTDTLGGILAVGLRVEKLTP
jgi:gliding motility-associated lipoprotein GldH